MMSYNASLHCAKNLSCHNCCRFEGFDDHASFLREANYLGWLETTERPTTGRKNNPVGRGAGFEKHTKTQTTYWLCPVHSGSGKANVVIRATPDKRYGKRDKKTGSYKVDICERQLINGQLKTIRCWTERYNSKNELISEPKK